MVLVFVLAEATRGSKRWIDVGPFQFQPSEFGKLLFVLALAGFLAERARRIGEWRTVLSCVGLGLLPMLLVFAQPDIGTSLVYAAALAAVLFVGGVRWPHLAALLAVAVAVVVSVALAAARGGRRGAQAVPDEAPHRLHESRRGPRRA